MTVRTHPVLLLLLPLLCIAACAPPAAPDYGDVIATLPPADAVDVTVTRSSAVTGIVDVPAGVGSGDAEGVTAVISGDANLLFTVTALNSTGLWAQLEGAGPYTVFAPANVAFSRTGLAPQQMDPDDLFAIMQNHIVEGRYTAADFAAGMELTTLAGDQISIPSAEQVEYAPIISADLESSNGVVHIIDGLLLPPETGEEPSVWGWLERDGRFTQLISLMEGSDLMYLLRFDQQPDAFLAPTDDAFAALPDNVRDSIFNDPHLREAVVQVHLITQDGWPLHEPLLLADIREFSEVSTGLSVTGSGFGFGFYKLPVTVTEDGDVRLDDALIVEADNIAWNGAVHVIDRVLVPELPE